MPTLFLASTEDPAGMKIIDKIAEKYSFKTPKQSMEVTKFYNLETFF